MNYFLRKKKKQSFGKVPSGKVVEPASVATAHEYTASFYVQVYREDRSTCRTPLKACYHHIRIYDDWTESGEGITLRFQDMKRLKPKNNLLKVRMISGRVYHVDFVHRTVLKKFLDECVQRQFLADTPVTIKELEVLNRFFKPVYYPNNQSKFFNLENPKLPNNSFYRHNGKSSPNSSWTFLYE